MTVLTDDTAFEALGEALVRGHLDLLARLIRDHALVEIDPTSPSQEALDLIFDLGFFTVATFEEKSGLDFGGVKHLPRVAFERPGPDGETEFVIGSTILHGLVDEPRLSEAYRALAPAAPAPARISPQAPARAAPSAAKGPAPMPFKIDDHHKDIALKIKHDVEGHAQATVDHTLISYSRGWPGTMTHVPIPNPQVWGFPEILEQMIVEVAAGRGIASPKTFLETRVLHMIKDRELYPSYRADKHQEAAMLKAFYVDGDGKALLFT